jgi:hypothetical protein
MPPITASSHGRIFTFSFDRISLTWRLGIEVDHATLKLTTPKLALRYAQQSNALSMGYHRMHADGHPGGAGTPLLGDRAYLARRSSVDAAGNGEHNPGSI